MVFSYKIIGHTTNSYNFYSIVEVIDEGMNKPINTVGWRVNFGTRLLSKAISFNKHHSCDRQKLVHRTLSFRQGFLRHGFIL